MGEKRDAPQIPTGSVENLSKRARQTELFRPVLMSDLPQYGTAVSKSIHCYTASQLESMPGVPNYVDFIGLDEAKAALDANIGLVREAPQHFRLNPRSLVSSNLSTGKTPIQHTLLLYGSEGSGKRCLIRSFCAAKNLSLLEVDPVLFDANELDQLYTHAYSMAPAIILFNRCENSFQGPHAGKLWTALNTVVRHRVPVWTVFSTTLKPDMLPQILRDSFPVSCWTRQLSTVQQEQHWRRLLKQYPAIPCEFSSQEIQQLTSKSANYNARDIEQLVQRVCLLHVQHYSRSLNLYANTDSSLAPPLKAYLAALNIETGFLYVKNISYYTGEQQY